MRCVPPAAGKQPDLDLGQAEARLRIVRGDPVMAGKRQLEAAAHRGAVERRDPGLAARLQPPVNLRELRLFSNTSAARLLRPSASGRLVILALFFQHGQIGAAPKLSLPE